MVTLQPWEVYALAALIVAVAFWRGRSVKAKNVHNSVVVGDNTGVISVTNNSQGEAREQRRADWVGWAIGAVGVLIAAAQLVHDIFFSAH